MKSMPTMLAPDHEHEAFPPFKIMVIKVVSPAQVLVFLVAGEAGVRVFLKSNNRIVKNEHRYG